MNNQTTYKNLGITRIIIYTERQPCTSCGDVIGTFNNDLAINIHVDYVYVIPNGNDNYPVQLDCLYENTQPIF